jgi:hypothetical protein
MSDGWVIPEDSSVSADAPDFFHLKHVPIKQQTMYKSIRRSASSDLLRDPRYQYCQSQPDAHKERIKNHSRMLHTDVGDLVQQKKIARSEGQDFPILFPVGVNHRQALQMDPEGDGMRELPKKTLLPHSIHSMADMCGGRKPKVIYEALGAKENPHLSFKGGKETKKSNTIKQQSKVNTARDIAAVKDLY